MKYLKLITVIILFVVSPVYALDSNGIIYDNSTSGSSATNVNDALNDLYSKLNDKQTEINNIKNIGNATSNKILSGYTAYVKGNTITGSIPSKGATTYTPGTTNQTIASGSYLSGIQTIKGDSNLLATNIAMGKSIFGINGSYTSDANAVAGNILSGKTAYVNGSKITGTMPNRVSTANVTQDKAWSYNNRIYFGIETGFYPSGGFGGMTGVSERYITYESLAKTIGLTANKLVSGNTVLGVSGSIPSKGAATYTPGVSNQTIASGYYLSGTQTIKGDANLVASSIAKGKSIFGVTGTYTSDATATAADIKSGKTAYVNGSKITGTMSSNIGNVYIVKTSSMGQTSAAIQLIYIENGVDTIKSVSYKNKTGFVGNAFDLKYTGVSTGWQLTFKKNMSCNNGINYTNGQVITWKYNTSVDYVFY